MSARQTIAGYVVLRFSKRKVFAIVGSFLAFIALLAWVVASGPADSPALTVTIVAVIGLCVLFLVRELWPVIGRLLAGDRTAVAVDGTGRLSLPASGLAVAFGDVEQVEYLGLSSAFQTLRFTFRDGSSTRTAEVRFSFLEGSVENNIDRLRDAFAGAFGRGATPAS